MAGGRYLRREAGNAFYANQIIVSGDIVAGSQRKMTEAGRPSKVVLSAMARCFHEQELKKVAAVFAPAKFVSQADGILRHHRVVILQGEAGVGKVTAGIHLLLGRGLGQIVDINPQAAVDQLLEFEFQRSCGYLVDKISVDTARHLSRHVLAELCHRLEGANAYAVLTVDSRVTLEPSDVVVFCDRVADLNLVFDRHVDWYLSETDPVANRHRARSMKGVDKLLEERLAPAELDQLAELLVKAVHGEIGEIDAFEQFEANARREIDRWFRDNRDLGECALMVSMAVLGGGSYLAVADGAERLHQALLELSRRQRPLLAVSSDEAPANLLFGHSRSGRLKAVSATLTYTYEGTETNSSLVDMVAFNNPAWYSAVLRHVWDEHDLIRRPLLEWLRTTCLLGDLDVRTRAAAAVGELSEYDFGYMWREVITVWAGDDDSRVRDAAALALGIPAWQNSLAPQIVRTLFSWSADGSDWRRQWTAAAAFGGYWIGLRFPDAALQGLELIARTEETSLLDVVTKSVAKLFELGTESHEYAARVLRALHRWSRPDEASKFVRRSGLVTFMNLAIGAEGTVCTTRGNPWPPILRLMHAEEDGAQEAVELWLRGLADQDIRGLALEVLRFWTRQAKDDPELVDPLSQFVVLLARRGGDRGRQRLAFYFERWSRDRAERSEAVQRMLTTLTRGG